MTSFIVFVLLPLLLIGGRHVRGVTENIVNSTSGSTVTLKAESIRDALKCTLETARSEKLEYVPGNRQIRGDLDSIDAKTCSFRINKANDTHAGVWNLTAYTVRRRIKGNENNIDVNDDVIPEVSLYTLYIHQQKIATPSQYIEVYDGHYIHMKHNENYTNLTACFLTGSEMKPINLLTEKRDNYQLFGQCGVRMKVNVTHEGLWKLDAVVNNYMLYHMSFNIEVHQVEKKDPNDMLVIQWTRGSPDIISLSGLPEICQIIDPNGVIVATSIGKCYHQVKVATAAHDGVWRARYNMYGMLKPIEQKFRVETLDPVIFNASVTRTEDNITTLYCRLEIKNARPKFCNFVRPDNMIFYMTPVIGTERYTAYISSADKSKRTDYSILECAITIRKLKDVDYGAWRCDLRIPYNARSYGSVLYVEHPDGNISIGKAVKTRTDNVYVKRGDPFTIKCVADSVLKYCWFRSPNGTSYSITQNVETVSPLVLHYQGNGLAFGECGAEISAAVDSDNGQWSCLMGVDDVGEITAAALVTVAESYLVAEQTEIAVNPRNDPVLSCHILPRMLDRTVHYCRWIRPDGYGIYNDISHRYTTNSSYSECRLVILDYYPEKDDGNWTCVAGLMGKNEHVEEAWNRIEVYHVSTTGIHINRLTVMAVTITLIIFGCGILGYFWNRFRFHRSRVMPPYSPQENYSSRSKFDMKEYQY